MACQHGRHPRLAQSTPGDGSGGEWAEEGAIEPRRGRFRRLIREYTRKAGVRNVERWIGSVCRKIACQVASGEADPFTVTAEQLEELLELPLFRSEAPLGKDEWGIAIGLPGQLLEGISC